MPYVNVPNDLSKVKTKMALNLTKRQLICFGCGAAVFQLVEKAALLRQAACEQGLRPRSPRTARGYFK